ncbi:MAG: hypothetical protein IKT33_03715 [Clostridia bacterium]|nr:hypothetical protein [Clostridia bacterium]
MEEVEVIQQALKQLYPSEKVEKVISICDNLFYNNYLEKGVLESRENIQAKIKAKVIQTFRDFFGKKYEDKIINKVAATNMRFIYQTDGATNSIAEFLTEIKKMRLMETIGFNVVNPYDFKIIAAALSGCNDDILQLNKLAPNLVANCLQTLNVPFKDFKRRKRLQRQVVKYIKEIVNCWDKATFSDNPEINDNLCFLQRFVEDVQTNFESSCEQMNLNPEDENVEKYFKVMLDPIVMHLDPQAIAWEMLHDAQLKGIHAGQYQSICFGICPDDTVILHEFLHELDDVAFEKGHREKGNTPYSRQFYKYQMLNEVVTEYFVQLMFRQRVDQKKEPIVHTRIEKSSYERLFEVLEPFLAAFLPELKEVRMREFPQEEFVRVIGQEYFDAIALDCNELIAVYHDRMLVEKAQLCQMTREQSVAELGFEYYGGVDNDLSSLQKREAEIEENLKLTVSAVLKQLSWQKRLENYLCAKSQDLAEYMKQKQNPHLHKLTRLASGFANTIATHVENKSIKRLGQPLTQTELEK